MLLIESWFLQSIYQPTNALKKYNSRQVYSYMFQHCGAILRDFARTKEYISKLLV
jgi:hypothetical protein